MEKNMGEINIFDLFLPGKLPSHIHFFCVCPNYVVRSTRVDDLIWNLQAYKIRPLAHCITYIYILPIAKNKHIDEIAPYINI